MNLDLNRMMYTGSDIELLQQAVEYLRELRLSKEHDPVLNYVIEDIDTIINMFIEGDED